jgi:hypothetical protein
MTMVKQEAGLTAFAKATASLAEALAEAEGLHYT